MEKKHDDKFQGYPHYPASEDITRDGNNNGKEAIDDNAPVQPYTDAVNERGNEPTIAGTDADITNDDLGMLEAAAQNMDTPDSRNLNASSLDNTDNDGDLLNEASSLRANVTGDNLDVPGASEDDADELIGEEDEENNYYSLGGDNHEAQEENKGE